MARKTIKATSREVEKLVKAVGWKKLKTRKVYTPLEKAIIRQKKTLADLKIDIETKEKISSELAVDVNNKVLLLDEVNIKFQQFITKARAAADSLARVAQGIFVIVEDIKPTDNPVEVANVLLEAVDGLTVKDLADLPDPKEFELAEINDERLKATNAR